MKTAQTSHLTLNTLSTIIAMTSALALQPAAKAAVTWDSPAAVPAGQRVEYAKAAIATDAAGNVFSAGYRDYGAGNVQALVTYRLNGGGGLLDSMWRPSADQFYYTGIAFDAAAKCLYLTGTRVVAGTNTWFVRCVSVNPGVGIGAQNWLTYLNPAVLGIGAVNSFGSSIAFDGVSLFVSGCLTNGIVAVKVVPATGALDATWGAVAPANAGVRYMIGGAWTCPSLLMPGSVAGGIFHSVRQSFVRVTNSSVFLGGTLNRATASLEDMAILRVGKGAGAVAPGFPVYVDNANQRDCMFGLAAITDYPYATGASVNGASVPTALTVALMANGTPRGGSPILGALGSYSNDIEAFNNAGTFTFSYGGNNAGSGFVTRYTSPELGVLSLPASFAFGAVPTDEVCDLTIGFGATTGIVYATGQVLDIMSGTNGQQVMRIDNAGFVSTDRLPSGYTEDRGNGVIFCPAGTASVFTSGNSIKAAAFNLQRSSVTP